MSEFKVSEFAKMAEEIEISNAENLKLESANFLKKQEKMLDNMNTQLKTGSSDLYKIKYENSKNELYYNETKVNIQKMNEALKEGEYIKSLKELGVKDEVLNSAEVKKYDIDYKKGYEEQQSTIDIKKVEKTTENGVKNTEKFGEPTNEENLKEIIEKNSDLNSEMNKKLDKLKEKMDKDNQVPVGTWVKRVVVLSGIAGTAFAAYMLYNFIKDHQDVMNGCWLIKKDSDNKCKIDILTCNSEDIKSCDEKNCIICPDISNCTKDVNNTEGTCFNKNICVHYTNEDSKTVQTCDKNLGDSACDGNKTSCSTYCDSNKIECPDGYTLKCVNVDFWGAAEDFFGEPLEFVGGIIGKI